MGKGHRTCEICGIKERHNPGDKSLFFSKFPLDPNRCREWLTAIGNEELVYLPIEKLHEQRNVCGNHFLPEDFNKNRNRLKRHAIPTLNLIALPLIESQLTKFPLHVWTEKKDHPPEAVSSIIQQDRNENILDMQTITSKTLFS